MASGVKTGVCRLCGAMGDLCDSHIFSKFLFKPFEHREGGQRRRQVLWLSSSEEKIAQDGPKERLLCRKCEHKLSEWENHVNAVMNGGIPLRPEPHDKLVFFDGLSYEKTKLFLLSILWRISISTLFQALGDKLGNHEEKIRNMILGNSPGTKNEYPIFCFCLKSRDDLLPLIFSRSVRIGTSTGRDNMHLLFLNGFLFLIFTTSHNLDDEWMGFALRETGRLPVVFDDLDNPHMKITREVRDIIVEQFKPQIAKSKR